MIFLETARLLFRSHEVGDEPDFVSMHTDAEVRRYVGGQGWPVEKARSRFREQHLGRPTGTYGLWATVFKEVHRLLWPAGPGKQDGRESRVLFGAALLGKRVGVRGVASSH